MTTVTCYFDVVSSASYLAWTQLPRIAKETGADIAWRPMFLGGLFRAANNHSPLEVPAKAAYIARDFKRFADRYGVPFQISEFFPVNTAGVMRMSIGVQERYPERFVPFVSGLFTALFADGKNLADEATVQALITSAGLDASEIAPLANDPAFKDKLRANTDEALARGAFGAPTMFVGDEMFFGQDRLDFVREALAAK